ncbi:hypothetical protein EZS27_020916 [termite gut metagenome]|uniref:Uncharacterized protein n=1 Tax=termite gut metagenome TaxID=433724 RepID=A0A5J4R9I4_9ZZZZ
MNNEKIDISAVYTLFEELKELLEKSKSKSVESVPIDVMAINNMTERFEDLIEEVKKPKRTEIRHIINLGSSKIFFLLIIMSLVILTLSFAIYNQRQTISQYRNNDLKYRYIKMQGQMIDENIYQLERLFEYRDSIGIIRKQVEEYERLVQERAEKIERARRNADEAERLKKKSNLFLLV